MNLCTDPTLKDLLKKRGITAEVFDAILSNSEKQQMLEHLEVFASSWFMSDGKDISEYRNVSIGAAIHDDVLTLFSNLYHVSLVLQKVKYSKSRIVFYQSESCSLPDNVEKMLVELGISIETTDDQYPFLCYKKYFEKTAYTGKIFSGILYDKYSKTRIISLIRPGVKSLVYKLLFKIVNSLFLNSKKIIQIRPMRRLQPMIYHFMNNGHKHSDIQLLIEFHESNLGSLLDGRDYFNPLRLYKQLIKLAKRGIFLKHPINVLAPKNDKLSNYLNRKAKLNQINLIKKSKGSLVKSLKFSDMNISNFFIHEFLNFYLHHFNKFTILINKLYHEVEKNNVNNYVVESINPFMAQVLTNLDRNIFLIHVSRWLNSQYFCDQFINKVKHKFFLVASSKSEHERILKQDFDNSSIIMAYENYFDNRNIKKSEVHNISEKKHFLEGKTILVTPPPLAALCAFRLKLDSTFFMNFVIDIITTLVIIKVAKIVLRPGLDTTQVNSVNFTLADIYEHMLKDIKIENCSIIYRNEINMVDIEEDLSESDLVIGTLSACAIDAALVGVDYIAYDNSVFPFPDKLNWQIFAEKGLIPTASNKIELKNLLETYKPNQGRNLIDYIRPYNESSGNCGSIENIYSFELFN